MWHIPISTTRASRESCHRDSAIVITGPKAVGFNSRREQITKNKSSSSTYAMNKDSIAHAQHLFILSKIRLKNLPS